MSSIQRNFAGSAAMFILLTSAARVWADDTFVSCNYSGRWKQCVTVPLADSREDIVAKQFQPPVDGKAKIYIVRPHANQPRKKSQIFFDEQIAAEMAPATYAVLDIAPGEHRIKLRTDKDSELVVTTVAGNTYYVKYQLDLMFNTVNGKLTILDQNEGETQVLKSKKVKLDKLPGESDA